MAWLAYKKHAFGSDLEEPRVFETRTRAERDVHEYAKRSGVVIKDGKAFLSMYEGNDEEQGFLGVDATLYDDAVILRFSIVDGPFGRVEEVEVVSS
jgi:hypothetical protein